MDTPTFRKSAYFLLNTLGIIALWAFVGGCLARRSVQELGMHVTSPWINTLRWVAARWQSIVWSVAMPLALVLLFCLVPLVLGWISNIPVLGQPVALVLMLPVALMALGVGWVAVQPPINAGDPGHDRLTQLAVSAVARSLMAVAEPRGHAPDGQRA
jgi:hypothetical protein